MCEDSNKYLPHPPTLISKSSPIQQVSNVLEVNLRLKANGVTCSPEFNIYSNYILLIHSDAQVFSYSALRKRNSHMYGVLHATPCVWWSNTSTLYSVHAAV